MDSITIGTTLRTLRENANLSAKDVSEILKNKYAIDMNYRTLFNYEKGRSSPDIDRFLTLCQIYDCYDILYTFGYTEKKNAFTPIPPEEELIIKKYNSLPPSGKNMILGALGIEKEKQQQRISS
ncbi:MAG: helix-turn-helix transcriptional regulator [Lachnospiraceae bacterium]|nr:helix-turn-helix transcriptional regulator [Lachnospiraceae bacterium]